MIIVSGPSTVGKNPFIYKACELYNLEYIVPSTTRKIRVEEDDGRDYHFITKTQFQAGIMNGSIEEWDYCLNNYYGYSFKFPGTRKQITHGLSRMAIRIKNKYPDRITTIFLRPENVDQIFKNLKLIYSGNNLLLRTALLEEELCHASMFDHIFDVHSKSIDLLRQDDVVKILYGDVEFDCEHSVMSTPG